jgi:hypothetical protein
MARPIKRLYAEPNVIEVLRRWARSATIGARDKERANIILLRLDGIGVEAAKLSYMGHIAMENRHGEAALVGRAFFGGRNADRGLGLAKELSPQRRQRQRWFEFPWSDAQERHATRDLTAATIQGYSAI